MVDNVPRPEYTDRPSCELHHGRWTPVDGRRHHVCVIAGEIDYTISTKRICEDEGGDWVPVVPAIPPPSAAARTNRPPRKKPKTKARATPRKGARKPPRPRPKAKTKRRPVAKKTTKKAAGARRKKR
jgi:hypothetical protein